LIAMIAAIGKHACGQPSRSPPATTVLRLLHLIGDRAYDSDPLDEELRRRLDPVAAPNPRPLVPSLPGAAGRARPRRRNGHLPDAATARETHCGYGCRAVPASVQGRPPLVHRLLPDPDR